MTNKLKYFIGNWKMFGDFSSFKIVNNINQFSSRHKKLYKKSISPIIEKIKDTAIAKIVTLDGTIIGNEAILGDLI